MIWRAAAMQVASPVAVRLASPRKEPRLVGLVHKLKLDGFGPGLAPL
jgi:hypothetical protein